MRKLIAYFIKHSVAVNVIVIAFLIFGGVGAYKLNSSFFPLVDSKNISINVTYPGASPQEVEEGIIFNQVKKVLCVGEMKYDISNMIDVYHPKCEIIVVPELFGFNVIGIKYY